MGERSGGSATPAQLMIKSPPTNCKVCVCLCARLRKVEKSANQSLAGNAGDFCLPPRLSFHLEYPTTTAQLFYQTLIPKNRFFFLFIFLYTFFQTAHRGNCSFFFIYLEKKTKFFFTIYKLREEIIFTL